MPRKKWEKSVHLSVFAREKQLVHNNAIWQKMQCTFFFRCFPFWHFTNYFWLFPNNLTALNRSHNVTFGSWKNLVIQILYYLNCVLSKCLTERSSLTIFVLSKDLDFFETCGTLKIVGPKKEDFWPKINILKENHCILRIRGAPVKNWAWF